MTDTAVAEPTMRQGMRDDLAQMDPMDLTQVVEELGALIDTVLRSGYLDEIAGSNPHAGRALLILNVCQAQAERAIELSRHCEGLHASLSRSA
ncbi:hypothetical protein [Halomonas saccharevitans]|uniref:Uncharacterized protein n=1 Tax=Halomonas saccharevitans TaxID=416872 RepID=A0A1I7CKU3_9GAMM|nr:hypothetical protein [Halomonas saccharevitans]SFU00033.1 hypothetical protein SAMN04487956_1499 [Halomonas saccharevitans]